MVDLLEASGTPAGLAAVGYTDLTWDRPAYLRRGLVTTTERMPSAVLAHGPTEAIPAGEALDVDDLAVTDPLTGRRATLGTVLERRLANEGLAVVLGGRLVHESYRDGFTDTDRHIMQSCTKTLTTMAYGRAFDEGRLAPDQPIAELVVELAAIPAWNGVTLQHVLDMAVGVVMDEDYANPSSMYWRYAHGVGYYGPATATDGALAFVLRELVTPGVAPGTVFTYASYLTNLLALALQRTYAVPVVELYETWLYQRIGAEHDAILNLDAVGLPLVEGHLNLTLRDFVRWAYPLLVDGRSIGGTPVVPLGWVDEAYRPDPERAAAFARSEDGGPASGWQYHNQGWQVVPGRVLALLGIHGQFAYLDREAGLLIAGVSAFPDQSNALLDATLEVVWSTIARAVGAPPLS